MILTIIALAGLVVLTPFLTRVAGRASGWPLAVAYLAVCIAELKISKFLKSEMPVLLICSGAVGVVAVILYRLAVDIEMLLIYIL